MILDTSLLSSPVLVEQLRQGIKLFGVDAASYRYNNLDNFYSSIYPEHSDKPSKRTDVRVLFESTLRGSTLARFISLHDKIDTEIIVYSLTLIPSDSMIDVRTTDRKTLTLHIMNVEVIHGGTTTVVYKYYTRIK